MPAIITMVISAAGLGAEGIDYCAEQRRMLNERTACFLSVRPSSQAQGIARILSPGTWGLSEHGIQLYATGGCDRVADAEMTDQVQSCEL